MNLLEMDLSAEDAQALKESLEAWKAQEFEKLQEQVEDLKEEKIQELEALAEDYKTECKKEYAEKMITALKEMTEQIRAEVISEMIESNPEMKVLEEIKKLVAPTLDEEYVKNTYAEEILTLKEENETLKREKELREGRERLEELLEGYSSQTQKLIKSFINEGSADEVTEQFYTIIESIEKMDDDDEECDDEECDDKKKKSKKSKKSEDDDEDKDDDDEDEEDDEDEDAEETDEDFDDFNFDDLDEEFDSYTGQSDEGDGENGRTHNALVERMKRLSGF